MNLKFINMLQGIANRRARLNHYIESMEEQSHEMRANKGIYYTLLIMIALVFIICLMCCLFAIEKGGHFILS